MSIKSSVRRRLRGIGTAPSGTAGASKVARELVTSLIPVTPLPCPYQPSSGPLRGAVRRHLGLGRVGLLAGAAGGLGRPAGPTAGPAGLLGGLLARRRAR